MMLMSWQNREKSEQKQWWQCSQGVASAVHCVLILKFAVFQQKVITKSRPAASFKSTTTNTAVETVAGWPLDQNNLPLHFPQDLTRPPSLFKKFLYFEKVLEQLQYQFPNVRVGLDSIAVPVFAVWLKLTNTEYQNEYETRCLIYIRTQEPMPPWGRFPKCRHFLVNL